MRVVLEADLAVAPRATLVIESPGDELTFLQGQSLDDATRARLGAPLVLYSDDPDVVLPDFFDAGLAPAASSRAIAALSALGVDNLESYETVLVLEDGSSVETGHRVLNVVGRVACVDLQRSRYSTVDGELFQLQRMVLLPDRVPDLPCFRPHEWSQVIVVDGEVARGLTASDLTGLRLTPVDDWVNEDY